MKLMVLGASELQYAVIKEAQKMGVYVIAVDIDGNSYSRLIADKFINVSVLDYEKVYEYAKELNIDGIIAYATDLPLRTAAYVAEKMGLPGLKNHVARTVTDKYLARVKMKEGGVKSPNFIKVNTLNDFVKGLDEIEGNKIIKPVDSSGSRGVQLINGILSTEEIEGLFNRTISYSRESAIIIEEYLVGNEISVEALVKNGKTYIIAYTDKYKTAPPLFVEIGHSQPANLTLEQKYLINSLVLTVVDVLGLDNTLLHVEIIITSKGPMIVEVGARAGGDYIVSHLTQLSTGHNLTRYAIKLSLGMQFAIDMNITSEFNASIQFLSSNKGLLREINGENELLNNQYVVDYHMNYIIGDMLPYLESSSERIGYIIVKTPKNIDSFKFCNKVLENLNIIIDE